MHALLCIANCGPLQHPINGQVTLSGTVFESIANYSCNLLYSIIGDTSRECLANGTWSGIEPHCELDNLEAIIATVVAILIIIISVTVILTVFCVLYYQKKISKKAEEETSAFDLEIFK